LKFKNKLRIILSSAEEQSHKFAVYVVKIAACAKNNFANCNLLHAAVYLLTAVATILREHKRNFI